MARIAFVKKAIKDYETFLLKSHPESFYTRIIKFRKDKDKDWEKTNEQHILWLIDLYKKELINLEK